MRALYRSELLWLVHVVQARALGRKMLQSELPGIDWGAIDSAGAALKAELLKELTFPGEPAEMEPPGASGPPNTLAQDGGASDLALTEGKESALEAPSNERE